MSEQKYSIGKSFILAGNAYFSVENDKGDYYTYRISQPRVSKSAIKPYFVSVLTGPDNTADYTYLGLLNPETGEIVATRNSRISMDATSAKVIAWALHRIWNDLPFPQGYSVYHAGRCGRCGRKLTVPESIRSGIGPECASKL